MKKMISMLLAATFSLSCVAVGTGCTTTDDIVSDDKTINVRVYKAGFGDAFIYDLKQKFEEVYAAEGYKMNVLTPTYGSAGTAMVQEMSRGYENTGIDLYVTGAIMPNQVSPDGEYGEVAEDLSDIFNQTAINYDGTESTKKLSDCLNPDLVPFLCADNGKMYGLPWAQTSAGMVVNTKKLASYGVTEPPRTTNELFEIFDMIYNGVDGVIEGSDSTKTYPVTYNLSIGQGGAATYQNTALLVWLAQYDIDTYNEFLRMQEQNGDSWTDMAEGYKVFENENLKDVLTAGYHFMDEKYSADGSASQTLDQAQGLVMKDANKQNNAVFMLNGDWFLNEVKANYSTKLDDIGFMNIPVISALGVKLFGVGTAYNLSDAECDDLLSYICKLVDENKSIDDIIASVKAEKGIDLAATDAQAVATARGVCFARGIEHLMFITKGSTKRDIASLAIRMVASEDFAETFLAKANAASPYANAKNSSQYAFVNQAKALVDNCHFRAINSRVQGLRFKVLRSDYIFPGESNLAMTLYSKPTNKSYEEAANEMYTNSIAKAKEAWDNYNK